MTIRKRQLKNGFTWELCVTIQKKPRKQLRKSGFKTKAEAKAEEDRIIAQIANGELFVKDSIKFSEVFEIFIKHAEANFAENTIYNYKNIYKNHLKYWHDKRSKTIEPYLVQNWYDNKVSATGSYTLKNSVRLCRTMYNYALKLNKVSVNPFDKIEEKSIKKTTHKRAESEDVEKVLRICKIVYPDTLGIVACGFLGGLRRGEILGLKWKDINFQNHTIRIERQLTRYGIKEKLKTNSSYRSIIACDTLLEILAWHKKRQSILSEYVFTNKNGGKFSLKTLHCRFKKLLKMAGVEDMRFHDTRGTHVDLSIQAGIAPKVIQKTLGHSNIGTTMDSYAELLTSVREKAANLFEENLKFCEHIVNI